MSAHPPSRRRTRLPAAAGQRVSRTTPFGAVIAAEIERRGWTLEEAAAHCGVPLPTLWSYKNGTIKGVGPQARKTVIKIANGLGIAVEDALELVGVPVSVTDEQTILGLYRRLSKHDKYVAAELLRAFVNATRSQREGRTLN